MSQRNIGRLLPVNAVISELFQPYEAIAIGVNGVEHCGDVLIIMKMLKTLKTLKMLKLLKMLLLNY